MKKILCASLILSFVCTCFTFSDASDSLTSEISILRIPYTSNIIGVTGVSNSNIHDPLAPESFYITSDMHIYILDSNNNQILVFYNENIVNQITVKTKGARMLDIAVYNQHISILLSDNTIMIIDRQGNIIEIVDLSGYIEKHTFLSYGNRYEYNSFPYQIDYKNMSLEVLFDDGRIVNLADPYCSVPCKTAINDNNFEPISTKYGRFVIPSYNYPISIRKVTEYDDYEIYYTSEASYTPKGTYKDRRLYYISEYGIDKFVQLKSSDFTVPQRIFRISEEGQVYQMVTTTNYLEIVKLDFTQNYSIIPDYMKNSESNIGTYIVDSGDYQYDSMTIGITDKSIASQRANSLKNYQWTYIPSIHGDNKPSGVIQPRFLQGVTQNLTVTGIVYSYGGSRGIDTTYQGTTFPQAVSAGTYMGNCSSSVSTSSTAGLDCSGYVSIVYQLGQKYSTYSLVGSNRPFYYTTSAPEQYDIFNHEGDHVFILSYVNNFAPNCIYHILECTTTANYRGYVGYIDKCCFGSILADQLPSYYTLARYRYWQ